MTARSRVSLLPIASAMDDCQALARLGWLQMRQGLVAEARDSLDQAKCETGTPHATRRDLLLAMVGKHLGDPDLAAGRFLSARQSVHQDSARDGIDAVVDLLLEETERTAKGDNR